MRKSNDWAKEITPIDLQTCDSERICGTVRDRINAEKGSVITMKKNRRIKPLIIAAAIAAATTVSMITVNAATDGQLVEKIRLFINGEELDIDSSNIKTGVDENGDQYYELQVEEGDSEVSIELEEDVDAAAENEVIEDSSSEVN